MVNKFRQLKPIIRDLLQPLDVTKNPRLYPLQLLRQLIPYPLLQLCSFFARDECASPAKKRNP